MTATTGQRSSRRAGREEEQPTAARGEGLRLRAPAWVDGPMTSSHLVLGAAGMLLAIGLVMVFSASSIEAAKAGQPAWLPGVRQIAFAVVGLVAMLVAMHLPVGRIRQFSGWALLGVFGLLLLVLVPGIGLKLNGSRAWFDLGFTNFQPSELGKLVFALWGAHVIALREKYLTVQSLLVPVLPVFGLVSLLLLAEPDMGAVVSLGLVLAGLMWAGGLSRRYIAGAVALAAVAVVLMVTFASYRMARITSFLDPFADPENGGYQAIRGLYALATGGVWGVGLGNSAMKWNILPHAESDYIFAIIGEELGFLGCLVVVTLYGILAWAGFRIARRSTDRFVQLASVAIIVWLVGQAVINMGYVVGLLPVTGVTLPLISAGGTSLVLTLFVVGLLVRFARAEPAAIAFQRGQRRGRLARLLAPVPSAAVDPVPSRRRREARSAGRAGPPPAAPRRGNGRTVARVPGDPSPVGPARGRRPDQPAPTPDARRGGADRQTVDRRQNPGDRPTGRSRPPAAAGPGLREGLRDRPWSGEPPAARGRPVPRSRPPRTERPGRPQ
ncbi:putative lipid II flippase FtsW [Modestobacter marinus]|uniref:Probable peptidoglycan glycosyltransferase FtsW n=1 Tax=Modestobacter marinus TaxID=477641 RepID=A0A846LPW4_9ACTN|nr:putative lipid II flippase FtsW [Modestobacter marinus]NIH69606.1 cell division protein FtsW [Modestobacter marinus]GGL75196.1 putative cell division protein FtsW [Modestobacter marinus]